MTPGSRTAKNLSLRRALAVAFGFALMLALASAPASALGVQQAAPKNVTTALGRVQSIAALSEGKALVLVFVRADCPISQRYAPGLLRIASQFDRAVELVVVYVEPSESQSQVPQHRDSYYPGLRSIVDRNGALTSTIGARVSSEVAVFDRNNVLVYQGRIDDRYPQLGLRRSKVTSQDLLSVLREIEEGRSPRFRRTSAVGCHLEM